MSADDHMKEVCEAVIAQAFEEMRDGMRKFGATDEEIERVTAEAKAAGNDQPFLIWTRKRMGR